MPSSSIMDVCCMSAMANRDEDEDDENGGIEALGALPHALCSCNYVSGGDSCHENSCTLLDFASVVSQRQSSVGDADVLAENESTQLGARGSAISSDFFDVKARVCPDERVLRPDRSTVPRPSYGTSHSCTAQPEEPLGEGGFSLATDDQTLFSNALIGVVGSSTWASEADCSALQASASRRGGHLISQTAAQTELCTNLAPSPLFARETPEYTMGPVAIFAHAFSAADKWTQREGTLIDDLAEAEQSLGVAPSDLALASTRAVVTSPHVTSAPSTHEIEIANLLSLPPFSLQKIAPVVRAASAFTASTCTRTAGLIGHDYGCGAGTDNVAQREGAFEKADTNRETPNGPIVAGGRGNSSKQWRDSSIHNPAVVGSGRWGATCTTATGEEESGKEGLCSIGTSVDARLFGFSPLCATDDDDEGGGNANEYTRRTTNAEFLAGKDRRVGHSVPLLPPPPPYSGSGGYFGFGDTFNFQSRPHTNTNISKSYHDSRRTFSSEPLSQRDFVHKAAHSTTANCDEDVIYHDAEKNDREHFGWATRPNRVAHSNQHSAATVHTRARPRDTAIRGSAQHNFSSGSANVAGYGHQLPNNHDTTNYGGRKSSNNNNNNNNNNAFFSRFSAPNNNPQNIFSSTSHRIGAEEHRKNSTRMVAEHHYVHPEYGVDRRYVGNSYMYDWRCSHSRSDNRVGRGFTDEYLIGDDAFGFAHVEGFGAGQMAQDGLAFTTNKGAAETLSVGPPAALCGDVVAYDPFFVAPHHGVRQSCEVNINGKEKSEKSHNSTHACGDERGRDNDLHVGEDASVIVLSPAAPAPVPSGAENGSALSVHPSFFDQVTGLPLPVAYYHHPEFFYTYLSDEDDEEEEHASVKEESGEVASPKIVADGAMDGEEPSDIAECSRRSVPESLLTATMGGGDEAAHNSLSHNKGTTSAVLSPTSNGTYNTIANTKLETNTNPKQNGQSLQNALPLAVSKKKGSSFAVGAHHNTSLTYTDVYVSHDDMLEFASAAANAPSPREGQATVDEEEECSSRLCLYAPSCASASVWPSACSAHHEFSETSSSSSTDSLQPTRSSSSSSSVSSVTDRTAIDSSSLRPTQSHQSATCWSSSMRHSRVTSSVTLRVRVVDRKINSGGGGGGEDVGSTNRGPAQKEVSTRKNGTCADALPASMRIGGAKELLLNSFPNASVSTKVALAASASNKRRQSTAEEADLLSTTNARCTADDHPACESLLPFLRENTTAGIGVETETDAVQEEKETKEKTKQLQEIQKGGAVFTSTNCKNTAENSGISATKATKLGGGGGGSSGEEREYCVIDNSSRGRCVATVLTSYLPISAHRSRSPPSPLIEAAHEVTRPNLVSFTQVVYALAILKRLGEAEERHIFEHQKQHLLHKSMAALQAEEERERCSFESEQEREHDTAKAIFSPRSTTTLQRKERENLVGAPHPRAEHREVRSSSPAVVPATGTDISSRSRQCSPSAIVSNPSSTPRRCASHHSSHTHTCSDGNASVLSTSSPQPSTCTNETSSPSAMSVASRAEEGHGTPHSSCAAIASESILSSNFVGRRRLRRGGFAPSSASKKVERRNGGTKGRQETCGLRSDSSSSPSSALSDSSVPREGEEEGPTTPVISSRYISNRPSGLDDRATSCGGATMASMTVHTVNAEEGGGHAKCNDADRAQIGEVRGNSVSKSTPDRPPANTLEEATQARKGLVSRACSRSRKSDRPSAAGDRENSFSQVPHVSSIFTHASARRILGAAILIAGKVHEDRYPRASLVAAAVGLKMKTEPILKDVASPTEHLSVDSDKLKRETQAPLRHVPPPPPPHPFAETDDEPDTDSNHASPNSAVPRDCDPSLSHEPQHHSAVLSVSGTSAATNATAQTAATTIKSTTVAETSSLEHLARTEALVLDRLGWRVHVSIDEYKAVFEDLMRTIEEEKEWN